MDPVELLVRGVAALLIMALIIALARRRFQRGPDAPGDIGLD